MYIDFNIIEILMWYGLFGFLIERLNSGKAKDLVSFKTIIISIDKIDKSF